MASLLFNAVVLFILVAASFLQSGWDDTTRIWAAALFVILGLGSMLKERTEKPETTRDEE